MSEISVCSHLASVRGSRGREFGGHCERSEAVAGPYGVDLLHELRLEPALARRVSRVRGRSRRREQKHGGEGGEGDPHLCIFGTRPEIRKRQATGAAAWAPVAGRDVAQRATFAAFGVGCAEAAKSDALASVSWPSGSLMSLEPGAAVVGGAAAGVPSPSPFEAVP